MADPLNVKWAGRVKKIDSWFNRFFGDIDHCRAAFVSEQLRAQLPPVYRG